MAFTIGLLVGAVAMYLVLHTIGAVASRKEIAEKAAAEAKDAFKK